MKFFAVHISDMESEQFLSASNDQIGTWLFLHALCSKRCNKGTIQEAATLSERFWSRHGITADILTKPSPLWSWHGDDLTVTPYDIDGQSLFEKKSKGGQAGAAKRWKGSENRTPIGTPIETLDAPNITLPNITQPEITDSFALNGASSEKPKKSKAKGTLEEMKAFAVEIDLPASDGEATFFKWEGNGWKNDGKPIKDWKATMRSWKVIGCLPSLKTRTAQAPEGTIMVAGRVIKL